MNNQIKNQGLLEQIRQGDQEATNIVANMVRNNNLMEPQLQNVLCAAAAGRALPGGEAAQDLARLTAWKMPSELVLKIAADLVAKLGDPDAAAENELVALSRTVNVLIEEGIIRNGKVIEIADAIARGIYSTKDPKKIRALDELKETILQRLPGSVDGDISTIYHAAFTLAEKPNVSPSCMFNNSLRKKLERAEAGEPNLNRMMGKDRARIVETMQWALALKPKPLSDGDPNLPMPARKSQAPSLVKVISSTGRSLAFRP